MTVRVRLRDGNKRMDVTLSRVPVAGDYIDLPTHSDYLVRRVFLRPIGVLVEDAEIAAHVDVGVEAMLKGDK